MEENDGVSPYVCKMCTRRLQSLENAIADIEEFTYLAQSTLASLQRGGSVKRTRVTCGEVGVSPNTITARPSSKAARLAWKKLVFQCKLITK